MKYGNEMKIPLAIYTSCSTNTTTSASDLSLIHISEE